ncbi:lycopene beta-cyclase CrtY [Roseomonas marmotae]|uniref:Lycopene beta-cyclase CrtY n=1 Tax=Roseomonas marmotae TaxID=2768161 RepID=A0ABS3KA06_9PROT|nr:lycopene beta-cyclase CrtY [Roseomonas marmotae]MBO1073473.1 lycopene beta-cyclase CrtY [Roseomonas marmotae]QTI80334.1 lycopene beta-cyclase CrtY [Roseomonas marmotae]
MAARPLPLDEIDLLLVGGGLANGLIALRLRQRHPGLRLALVEAGATLGGIHTWSFFEQDLTPAQRAWIAPLVAHRWDGYEVRFPARRRQLSSGYASITSARFHDQLMASLPGMVRLEAPVARLAADHAELADGTILHARAVIDGRGPAPAPELALGYQKFLGQEVVLAAPHGLMRPIVMDATVAQIDGYRFLYVLPFSERSLLIEDTRYADGPALEPPALRAAIAEYAASQGWRIREVLREEEGVLPVALDGDIAAFWRSRAAIPQAGLRAALFHPTTGYSLPDAVRLAEAIAAVPRLDAASLNALVRSHSTALWRQRSFFRRLNRMLFRAARPERRYRVLERFYGLPQPLIERFYAARPTLMDKLRILAGKPPVPLRAALPCLMERGRPD